MLRPQFTDFQRYLAAKRTVDDRALNAHVWETFLALCADENRSPAVDRPKVLEIGSGIGTMIERLLETERVHRVDYTAVDADVTSIGVAARRLQAKGGQVQGSSAGLVHDFQASRTEFDLTLAKFAGMPDIELDWQIHLRALDLFALIRQSEIHGPYEMLIAHAFLDLVDTRWVLQRIPSLLRPGAHLLLTINFDGATIFQPEIDPAFDGLVETLYHATMDDRVVNGAPSGDSRTGRRLFGQLTDSGYSVAAAGSSDWVVGPFNGAYIGDEAYFLHFIVDTICGALAGHPQLDADLFRQWVATRHHQIERNELVYIAHQMDYLARWESRTLENR